MRKVLCTVGLFLALLAPVQAQSPQYLCGKGVGTTCTDTSPPLGVTTSAVESGKVFKASAGTISGFQVNTAATAVWVMVFNAAAVPSNGTVAGCGNTRPTTACVAKWYQVPVNTTLGVLWSPGPPLLLNLGITVACSSTGPFTLTLSATCTFSGEVN